MALRLRYISLAILFILSLWISCSYAKAKLSYEVYGVDPEVQQNIYLRLSSMLQDNKLIITPKSANFLYKRGKQEVQKAIEPYGFFRAHIASELSQDNADWVAKYFITPGDPLRINGVDIKIFGPGAQDPAFQKYIVTQPLKTGEPFSIPLYDKVKTKLFKIAKNQGYLRAFFVNKILVDLKRYTSYFQIKLFTGPQFYFGNITFKTLPYDIEFMRKFITFKPGEVFSSRKILKLQQQMEKSYYFKQVIITPDFKNIKDLTVPIEVFSTPPNSQRYSFGFGYGTLTGARISAGFSLRHIGNKGHHLEADLKLSRILSTAGITYYIPGNNPLTDEWLLGVYYKFFHPNAGRSSSYTYTGGFAQKFENWETSLTLNYLTDRFSIYTSPFTYSSHELYPSWKISYTKADSLTDPKNGASVNLTLQAASQKLLSTTSFAGIRARTKLIASPFSFSRILLRGDVGLTSVHNLPVYPMSLQYFAGGINSIRGFADSSIGPGKYLAVASAEYQHRIKGNLYAAIFYDAGYATNHFAGILNRGAGVGAVYNTQVGPIKLYLARALSKQTQPYSIEFSVGPEFS